MIIENNHRCTIIYALFTVKFSVDSSTIVVLPVSCLYIPDLYLICICPFICKKHFPRGVCSIWVLQFFLFLFIWGLQSLLLFFLLFFAHSFVFLAMFLPMFTLTCFAAIQGTFTLAIQKSMFNCGFSGYNSPGR